jgi:hypothetical protein
MEERVSSKCQKKVGYSQNSDFFVLHEGKCNGIDTKNEDGSMSGNLERILWRNIVKT